MKENEKELFDLMANLNVSPAEAQRMAREIRSGDELLSQADVEVDDTEVLERLEQRIRGELDSPRASRHGWKWALRAAAAAAMVMIALGAQKLWWGNGSDPVMPDSAAVTESYTLQDELAMWELAQKVENTTDMVIDDLLLAEVLTLWDEIDWEAENIFGFRKELNHENFIINTAALVGTGIRCV
jgi:hypothetical protein